MEWKDYHPEPVKIDCYQMTDIECPCCGKHLRKNVTTVLTSNPPKYQYECSNCGWVGYNY